MVSPDASTANSERRVVTVLFADISGFTALSEELEPEEVTSAMNSCFDAMVAITESEGGHVDKFIGDCAMVVFGAPKALERAPEAALRASLAIREAIEKACAEKRLPPGLKIHIGVNTGTVLAGMVGGQGRTSYTVMGDAVNVASRLKDQARPGQILVGHSTHASVRAGFAFGDRQALALKGKAEEVEAWELLGRRDSGQAAMPSRAGLGRAFVGRDREMSSLASLCDSAREGRGSVAFVSGEPGVGKSRLLAEFLSSRSVEGFLVLQGKCLAVGAGLPFHPFAAMLDGWAGISEAESGHEADARLELRLRYLGPGAPALFPFLALLRGSRPEDGEARPDEGVEGQALEALIQKAAREFLRLLSRDRPVLVLLEDLHWADEASLCLLESILSLVAREKIGLVLTTRPDSPSTSGRAIQRSTRELPDRTMLLELEALCAEDSVELMNALLAASSREPDRGLPPRVRDTILRRSGGNPYFIEEVLLTLMDDGTLRQSASGWECVSRTEDISIPANISDLLMARMDRLEEGTRRIARVAAVIGRHFPFRVLAEASLGGLPQETPEGEPGGGREDEAAKGVQVLGEREIILPGNRPDEPEYIFRHALAQEVVYASIPLPERRELHRAVARAIERVYPGREEEHAGTLAWHCARAEDLDAAERYMLAAGEQARRSAASTEALAYYREALGLYLRKKGKDADPGKVRELKRDIARALFFKGRYLECVPYYDELLSASGLGVPRGGMARALGTVAGTLAFLAMVYLPFTRGRRRIPEELRSAGELGVEMSQALGSTDVPSQTAHIMSVARKMRPFDIMDPSTDLGRIVFLGIAVNGFAWTGRGLGVGRKAIEALRPFAASASGGFLAFYVLQRSIYEAVSGEWGPPEALLVPALEEEIAKGDLYAPSVVCLHAATPAIERGDRPTLDRCARSLETMAREYGNEGARNNLWFVRMRDLLKRRDHEEGLALVPAWRAFLEASTFTVDATASSHALAARFCLLAGDEGGARRELGEALRIVPESAGNVFHDGMIRGARAAAGVARLAAERTASRLPRREDSREARKACAAYIANSRHYAPDLAEALKLEGLRLWHEGRASAALRLWQRSLDEAVRLGATVELRHTLLDAAELLGDRPPGPAWRARAAMPE